MKRRLRRALRRWLRTESPEAPLNARLTPSEPSHEEWVASLLAELRRPAVEAAFAGLDIITILNMTLDERLDLLSPFLGVHANE